MKRQHAHHQVERMREIHPLRPGQPCQLRERQEHERDAHRQQVQRQGAPYTLRTAAASPSRATTRR